MNSANVLKSFFSPTAGQLFSQNERYLAISHQVVGVVYCYFNPCRSTFKRGFYLRPRPRSHSLIAHDSGQMHWQASHKFENWWWLFWFHYYELKDGSFLVVTCLKHYLRSVLWKTGVGTHTRVFNRVYFYKSRGNPLMFPL